jgi:hypothetical protein
MKLFGNLLLSIKTCIPLTYNTRQSNLSIIVVVKDIEFCRFTDNDN